VVRRNDAYGTKLDSLHVFDGPLIGDRPTEDADVTITDTEPGFAHIVGHADLDADGKTDLFVSNPDSDPNAVYVFLDALPVVTPAASAQVQIACSRQASRAGAAVLSPGDVSADGVGDLLVGASGEDTVYLIGGGEPGAYDLDNDAQAVLRGEHVGFSLAKGDVTGDGITDFVISDSSLTIGGSGVVVMPGFDL